MPRNQVSKMCVAVLALAAIVQPRFGHTQSVSPAKDNVPKQDVASDGGPSSLIVLFDEGSSKLKPEYQAVLDHASRAYNEGKPIVMVLTGSSDRTGKADKNLVLSQQRAAAVLRGLLDRGIPADRFQILAKGQTELPVPTPQGVPQVNNRRVVISWH